MQGVGHLQDPVQYLPTLGAVKPLGLKGQGRGVLKGETVRMLWRKLWPEEPLKTGIPRRPLGTPLLSQQEGGQRARSPLLCTGVDLLGTKLSRKGGNWAGGTNGDSGMCLFLK